MSTNGLALPDPDAEPTIDAARAAGLLGISKRSAYRAAGRGELPAVNVGRSVRFLTRPLLALLKPEQAEAA